MLRATGIPPPAQTVATRPLNTAFQVSALRAALVSYSVKQTVTASIVSGQSGLCTLQIASDQAMTQNLQAVSMTPGSQTFSLAIALQGVQDMACTLMGFVPAAYWVRLQTTNVLGSPVFSFLAGQEILVW